MRYNKTLLVIALIAVAFIMVFMADAYEKQMQDERVIKLQIETTRETDFGGMEKSQENIIIYDQEDVEKIEEQLRELGYIE